MAPPERPGPPGGRRDRNRRQRLAALERSALRLFLRRGVSAVSVDTLAKGAKMAKGSFYRYATSKAHLIERLIRPLDVGVSSAFSRCRQDLEKAERAADLPPIYMRLAADFTVIVRDHPDLVRLYLQESRGPAEQDRAAIASLSLEIRTGAKELTDLALERGLLHGVPSWLSSAVVVGAAEELLLDHLSQKNPARDPSAVQLALVSMVLRGIASWEPTSP